MNPNFDKIYMHYLLLLLSFKDLLCRYLNAIERNPEDPDAYYNWALVLQVNLYPLNHHICMMTLLTLTVTNTDSNFIEPCMDITILTFRF
jgi:hypothetical protein